MFSMIKMDIRRLLHCKSFYLAIAIFLLFSGYCIYAQAKWQVINHYPIPQKMQLKAGLYSIIDYYLNSTLQYMFTFTFKNGLIIFGVFVTYFIANDDQSGFIKNKCMMCGNKNIIIYSKLIMTIILSVMILLLSFILTTALGYLLISDFTIGSINEIFVFASTSLLFYITYFTALSFLYYLIKSKLPSILLSILFPLGLTTLILQPILNEFIKYSLSGIFLNFPMVFDSNVSYIVIIMCFIFIVFYHSLNLLIFNKRDI